MPSYILMPSEPDHVATLAANLRASEHQQANCMGISALRALAMSFRHSLIARTAFVGGEIAVMGGVGGTPLGSIGEPWLITGPAIERVPLALVRECRIETRRWLEIFGRLEGNVLASYAGACRFAEVLGFAVGEPYDRGGVAWRRIVMER